MVLAADDAAAALADADFIEQLLALPAADQHSELRTAGLWQPAGLAQLLSHAGRLAGRDPVAAGRLALLAAASAADLGGPEIALLIPQAHYLAAQTFAIRGDLAQAQALIQQAHDEYLAAGAGLKALRTNLGLIHVLNEQGRHQEALAQGQAILDRLADFSVSDEPEAQVIQVLAHNNRGICFRRMGRYQPALEAYDAAEAACRRFHLDERLGDIHNNRGAILMHLGRMRAALAAYQTAAAAYGAHKQIMNQASCLANIGEAQFLLGDFQASLAALAAAEAHFRALDAAAPRQMVLLHRGDVYLALNLFPEALAAYEEADTVLTAAGMTHYQARARWGQGIAHTAFQAYDQADRCLQAAAELYEAAGNQPLLSSVLLEQSALHLARGQRAAAAAAAAAALDLVVGKDWPVQESYAHLRLADLALPDLDAASAHLEAARVLVDRLQLPQLRYRLARRQGRVSWRAGRFDEAEALLQAAVADIERLRGNVAQESMRLSFLYDKIAAYEALLQLYLERFQQTGQARNLQLAFSVAERAKSRTLVDLMTGIGGEGLAARAPAGEERLHFLQAELNAIYSALLGAGDNVAELYQRAQAIEAELSDADRPQPADNLATAWDWDQLQSQLAPELTLVIYHLLGDEIIAFVQRAGKIAAARAISTTGAVQAELQMLSLQWDRFRAGADFAARHQARLTRTAQRILGSLFDMLLRPLLPLLPAGSSQAPAPLAIVPCGLLHQVPFHALFDGTAYLLENYLVSYAPSATVLALCQARAASSTPAGLVVGVADELIPAARTEAAAVANSWRAATLLTDEKATKEAVLAAAGAQPWLHFACHGLFRADNPMYSAIQLHDGWLTAADIAGLSLTDAVVTLSACESGRHKVMAGDEILGLTRAFLGAGAAALLVTLWLVPDAAAGVLMRRWYDLLVEQPELGRVGALRGAQLAVLAEYEHPYYWAPFILIGRR